MIGFQLKLLRSLLALLVLEVASTAAAQEAAPDDPDDSVEAITARKLFLEGRALLDHNQPRAACDKLERSHKLVPTLAALLNLGLCHSYSGHLATAHDYYRQAEVLATLQKDTRRREFAHDEAAALAPRRATLTLRITGNTGDALDVRIDDIVKPREVWELPMFIDAGEHRIRVQAAGLQSWEGNVSVTDGNQHVVVIPELVSRAEVVSKPPDESVRAAEAPVAPELDSRTSQWIGAPANPHTDQTSSLSPSRIAALSVAGAGVVALGLGLAFTLSARATYDESEAHCRSNDRCTPTGVELREDAHDAATRATVFAISGAVALGAGAVWWFVAGPERPGAEAPLGLVPGPDSLAARWSGSF